MKEITLDWQEVIPDFPQTEAFRRGEVPEPWVVAWRVGEKLVSVVDDMEVADAHRGCCEYTSPRVSKRYLVAIGKHEPVDPFWAPASHYRAPSLLIFDWMHYETDDLVDAMAALQSWDNLVFKREEEE